MIKSTRTKSEGELLIRRMSQLAQNYYNDNDGIVIYADDRYDNEGIEVSTDFGNTFSTYEFEELQHEFEMLQMEIEEI